MLLNKLKAMLSFLGIGGRSVVRAEDLQSEPQTLDDQNRIYLLGCNLIKPYMKLHGVEAPLINEKAREEVERGISLLQESAGPPIGRRCGSWARVFRRSMNPRMHATPLANRLQSKDHPDVAREFMFECLTWAARGKKFCLPRLGGSEHQGQLAANRTLSRFRVCRQPSTAESRENWTWQLCVAG